MKPKVSLELFHSPFSPFLAYSFECFLFFGTFLFLSIAVRGNFFWWQKIRADSNLWSQPFVVKFALTFYLHLTMSKSTHFIGQQLYSQITKNIDKPGVLRISRELGGERYCNQRPLAGRATCSRNSFDTLEHVVRPTRGRLFICTNEWIHSLVLYILMC